MKRDFKVTRWHDLKNYECESCPFATTQKELMLEHIKIHQPVETKQIMIKQEKYDRFGNRVEEA